MRGKGGSGVTLICVPVAASGETEDWGVFNISVQHYTVLYGEIVIFCAAFLRKYSHICSHYGFTSFYAMWQLTSFPVIGLVPSKYSNLPFLIQCRVTHERNIAFARTLCKEYTNWHRTFTLRDMNKFPFVIIVPSDFLASPWGEALCTWIHIWGLWTWFRLL